MQYAAFAWGVPLTGNNWPATIEIEGQPPAVKESDKTALPLRAVTPGYFKLMSMPLMDGREFRSTDDDKAPAVAIVNKAFAERYFPHGNVIGRKFWFNGRDKPGTTIVGEIANGRTDDLTQEASPEIYLPLWQANAFSKHLVIRTAADPRTIVVAVERELRSVDPTAAIENVKTLEQIRDESLSSRTFAMHLLTGFSAVGSRADAGGNLRRAFIVCGLETQGAGDSKRDGSAADGHSQIGLRRRISIDREWRGRRHCFGYCSVAGAEVVPVRSATRRSRDLDRGRSAVRRSGTFGVLGSSAAGGEG